MNEQIHWFSVEGRPLCDKENVQFQKCECVMPRVAFSRVG